jgi:hypothetical protein
MDFSATGTAHGGIRLNMDNGTRIFGGQTLYGLEWILPTSDIWTKRCLVRVLEGISIGNHVFTVECRCQANGNKFQIHGGETGILYSGFVLLFEEL